MRPTTSVTTTTSESISRRALIAATGSAVLLAGCLGSDDSSEEWAVDEPLAVSHAVQYNSPDCSCCDEYAAYLDDHIESELSVSVPGDIESVKRDRGVPGDLGSCHTVDIDGYTVEGHVPVEVISTLLERQPDIAGIALPGMPAGSPGMSGEKSGEWTVYAFDQDSAYEPFAEL